MEKFRRSISLYGLILIVVGSCVGSGIFLTPSFITAQLGSPSLVMIAWLTGGVIAVSGALTFAELSSLFPEAGGLYTHLRIAYGNWAGFLYGWSYLVVVVSGAIAALCLACANYIGYIFPISETGQIILAIAAVVFISIVNHFGVKFGDLFSNIFTTAKIIGIGLIIAIGFWLGEETIGALLDLSAFAIKSNSEANIITGFGAALIGVVFSYGGFQHASFLSAEVKNPARNVAMAMVTGTCIVTVIYLLTNLAYFNLLDLASISGSNTLAADALGTVWSGAGVFISILIAISTLGTAGIYTLSAPRLYHTMATDGLFLRSLTAVHKKHKTPYKAIWLQAVWAIVLILFWQTFEDLVTYIVFVDWIFLTMVAFAIFIFRKRFPDRQRMYKAFAYPVTPIIFIAISCFIIFSTIVSQPVHASIGLLFLGIGLVVFASFKKNI